MRRGFYQKHAGLSKSVTRHIGGRLGGSRSRLTAGRQAERQAAVARRRHAMVQGQVCLIFHFPGAHRPV